ncbi:actin cytoskeleton-regulatory complex protein PAN1 [Anoplophora glabripennis]|uniref:actin cytoskeleton-regulatory complex protein PAN1 n=1 Tax=Anoplophora glabripennis TaxID=217634 RepID=UPI000874230A|nr:actin cytoskeleton-regulatory complex protein PAN1 [Anoplophora glabripennis]
MIGSFWNLCRACPSMPVDKLHSEYRSTYRWHEYTGPRQEVVRRPPQANIAEKANDPQPATKSNDEDFQTDSLPKLEPAMPRRKKYPDLAYRHHEFLVSDGPTNEFCSADRARGREGGLIRKAISKISTEYRLQFAWPQGHASRRDAVDSAPRKSQSMGALKANAMVHKKRTDTENKDASELEPLVDDRIHQERIKEDFNSGGFHSKEVDGDATDIHKQYPDIDKNSSWYREVVELRKKAGEYKHRGWGSELAPERLSDIYNKQVELWDQVSRRSSLSALSLASMTHKSYTKEEKEDDNNRKSSPTKAYRNAENSARMIRDIIRHHLERTTGGSEFDGLILSPTREKLEPTIPRKDDDSRGSQKNSPKKSSPMKSSSLKRTNQKAKQGGPKKLRSQSVGPTSDAVAEKKSPKRQSRSSSTKDGRKSSSETPSNKRPRPSSLNTTVSSRSKSSSVVTKNEDDRLAKPLQNQNKSQSIDTSKQNQKVATKHRKGSKEAEQQKTETIVTEPKETTTNEQEHDSLTYEPVIKSPPEPTRVKSPEQILMRSPDPVNWTVPLDTGKTFTVTQNVREGDIGSRPHSEVKAWTPPEIPPPVAQSAPPTLTEQNKDKEQAGTS